MTGGICAWCTPPEELARLNTLHGGVSHTICPACERRMLADDALAHARQSIREARRTVRGLGWGWLLFPFALLATIARRTFGWRQ